MLSVTTGTEKAILGSLTAAIMALLAQVGVNGQMTIKEAVYALLTGLMTHATVFLTTNTQHPSLPVQVVTPDAPADPATPSV